MWFYMKYIVKNYTDRILFARLCIFRHGIELAYDFLSTLRRQWLFAGCSIWVWNLCPRLRWTNYLLSDVRLTLHPSTAFRKSALIVNFRYRSHSDWQDFVNICFESFQLRLQFRAMFTSLTWQFQWVYTWSVAVTRTLIRISRTGIGIGMIRR
jgi:hypothetical protein